MLLRHTHTPPPFRGNQSGYSGVSSFGFGGANARADVFAIASRGPRKPGQAGERRGGEGPVKKEVKRRKTRDVSGLGGPQS